MTRLFGNRCNKRNAEVQLGINAVKSTPTGKKFGELLVQHGFVNGQHIDQALHHQETMAPHKPLGEICVDLGFISPTVLRVVLDRYRKRRLLGTVLLKMGAISENQLGEALTQQKREGKRLGQILIDKRLITRADLAEALSIQLGIPKIVPSVHMADSLLLARATPGYFRGHRAVPLCRGAVPGNGIKEAVTVLMEDPLDVAAIADLGRVFNAQIRPAVSAALDLDNFLDKIFEPRTEERITNPAIPVFEQPKAVSSSGNDGPSSQLKLDEYTYLTAGLPARTGEAREVGKDKTVDLKTLSSPRPALHHAIGGKTSGLEVLFNKLFQTKLAPSTTRDRAKAHLATKNVRHAGSSVTAKNRVVGERSPDSVETGNNATAILNAIVFSVVTNRASDVYIESRENKVSLRYRIDGALRHKVDLPKAIAAALTARIKSLSGLDVAQRRRRQEGKIEVRAGGRNLDLRVSTYASMWGDDVVIHVLTRNTVVVDSSKLGLSQIEWVE